MRRLWLSALVALSACHTGPELPACDASSLLSVAPLAAGDFRAIVPLGNLNPSGHTFPTDHVYLYLQPPTPPETLPPVVPLVAPGHVWIVRAELHSSPTPPAYEDWTLTLASCRDVRLVLGHVSGLAPAVADRIGTVDGHCDEYDTGGRHFRNCTQDTDVELQPGDALGTAGGNAGQLALDVTGTDERTPALAYVNPGRLRPEQLHIVCPLDLFAAGVRDALSATLGGWDGSSPRTVEPRCGEVMQDRAGTAQGLWYLAGAPSSPEDPHLALVHDNVDPTIPVFSVGVSVPGLASSVYSFAPATSGQANRDFADVVPGATYCWDLVRFYGRTAVGSRLVASFATATALAVSVEAGLACGAGPWTTGAQAVAFER